jgi:hypothetical protein
MPPAIVLSLRSKELYEQTSPDAVLLLFTRTFLGNTGNLKILWGISVLFLDAM